MREWTRVFWPAVFKGFRFHLDVEELECGRRVSISNYAHGEEPITEDWGGLPTRVFGTAYVASEFVDVEAIAGTAVFHSTGPGLLTLPLGGILGLYRCLFFRRVRERDRNGYVAFDVEFVTAGLGSVPFIAGAILPRISAAVSRGRALLGSVF